MPTHLSARLRAAGPVDAAWRYTGVSVDFDGKAIKDLFDDNVQMREIKFKIAGDVYSDSDSFAIECDCVLL